MKSVHVPAMTYQRGIARNRGQFLLQTVQVFFVGLVIGMERTVLPSLAHDFGVTKGAFLFLASFVISFGLVKGALNLVAGSLSDRIGVLALQSRWTGKSFIFGSMEGSRVPCNRQ